MGAVEPPGLMVVNFAHPLTAANRAELAQITGWELSGVIDRPAQFDDGEPFTHQARSLVDRVGLSATQWQAGGTVLNLPGHAVVAAAVLAVVHGLAGTFPPVLRMRRIDSLNTFAVAEVVGLQALRDSARADRTRQQEQ